MTMPGLEDPVPVGSPLLDLTVRFERFPATIKGAFVVQGADGNPHSVEFSGAGLARIPTGPVRLVPLEVDMVHAAPTRNLFVPFEVPVSDLLPGWYTIVVRVRIDSGRPVEYRSRLFSMAWPRSDVRRGTVGLAREVIVGGRTFRVERVEMASDHAVVAWRVAGSEEGSERPAVLLRADGETVEPLPSDAVTIRERGESREGRALTYPVPRQTGSLSVALRLASGEESEPVPVPLS